MLLMFLTISHCQMRRTIHETNPKGICRTLNSTLLTDGPVIASAIQNRNFEVLQKIWHQLKGFAPVFCQDALVAEIARTESLCKHIASHQEQDAALSACELLQSSLQALQLEAAAHILQTAATTKPPTP